MITRKLKGLMLLRFLVTRLQLPIVIVQSFQVLFYLTQFKKGKPKIRFCTFIFLFISTLAHSCELTLGAWSYPPYQMVDQSDNWSGIDIDTIRSVGNAIDCKVDVVETAFGKGLMLLKAGKIDALSHMSKLESRVPHYYFIGPIRKETFSLVTTSEVTEDITSLRDIRNSPHLFGKLEGTYLGLQFDSLMKLDKQFKKRFVLTQSTISRIELVKKGRIDGFFSDAKSNEYLLTHSPDFAGMKLHSIRMQNDDVYIGLSKKTVSPALYSKLNKAFKRMEMQGTQ